MTLLTLNANHNKCLWIPVGGGALALAWQLPLPHNALDYSQRVQVEWTAVHIYDATRERHEKNLFRSNWPLPLHRERALYAG